MLPTHTGFGRSVRVMTPEQLVPFVVPFTMKGNTVANPCKLAPAYTEALLKKQKAIAQLREQIGKLTTDDGVQRDVQAVVEGQFKEWLATSGNIRQIYDLLKLSGEM